MHTVTDMCFVADMDPFLLIEVETSRRYCIMIYRDMELMVDFIFNLRLFLSGKIDAVTLQMGEVVMKFNGNILSCNRCKYSFETGNTEETFKCDVEQVVQCFNKIYNQFCKYLYQSGMCRTWFLCSSNFRKRLNKIIDEDPTANPANLLKKM